jgi:hypothetical protein
MEDFSGLLANPVPLESQSISTQNDESPMPIPRITKSNVQNALKVIDRHGVPKTRRSTRFCLIHNGRHYPPKYVLALAVEHATGRALQPHEHSGGAETNSRLRKLGFTVKACPQCHILNSPRLQPGATAVAPAKAASRSSPSAIARLVLIGKLTRRPEQLLLKTFENWPQHFVADFLITPGGFAEGTLPAGVPGKTGWQSDPRDFPAICEAAESVASTILTPRLLDAARGKARYLTLGIDLMAAPPSRSHAELVAVVDLRSGRILRWTGKSYPVAAQENSLWHVTNLKSHCLRLAGRRVLVLGCHDLNMFSQRAWKNQKRGSPRRERTKEMRKIAKQFRPEIILHHPHTTESFRTWQTAWAGARKLLHPAAWASAIHFPDSSKPCSLLASTLARTRSPNTPTLDILITRGEPPRYCFHCV